MGTVMGGRCFRQREVRTGRPRAAPDPQHPLSSGSFRLGMRWFRAGMRQLRVGIRWVEGW